MSEKAIIFDLDGVIVDTAKYHYLAWKNLANQLGFEFTKKQNELLKGVSRVASLEILLKLGNKKISEEKKQQLLVQKNDEYLGYVRKMDASEILPGVANLINFLIANKVKFALGSASKNAPLILEKVGLKSKFTAIVDGNQVTKAKPDPEVFLIAAKKLNVSPENCVVFEDAIAGVQAAKKAQMICVGMGEKEILKEADFVFSNANEISKEFLTNLIK
ncbi:MAG: beta-phosphoglucomutase [Lutibacter sp.]